ncbi:MAG: hypothetical protein ABI968_10255 [Acidobacteriota bacterium]
MRRREWISRAALLTMLACASSPPATAPSESPSNPAWLDRLIAQVQSKPVTNPPTTIYRYVYRGETVYYRTSRCCDIRSVVYDRNGAVLCEPDGGISNKPDPRCPDFFAARGEETLVFKDPRS